MTIGTALRTTVGITFLCGWASSMDEPTPLLPTRIFASSRGTWGLTVRTNVRDQQVTGSNLRLFFYDLQGRENEAWTRTLDFPPDRVLVDDAGRVATVNEWAHVGYQHSVVVLAKDGRILKDYALDDLLSTWEMRTHTIKTESNRVWTVDARFEFKGDEFMIVFPWNKTIRIDLSTGTVKRPGS